MDCAKRTNMQPWCYPSFFCVWWNFLKRKWHTGNKWQAMVRIYFEENIRDGPKKRIHLNQITSKPLIRSSLVWDADMQIRALANSSGVAGKADITTATCNSTIDFDKKPWNENKLCHLKDRSYRHELKVQNGIIIVIGHVHVLMDSHFAWGTLARRQEFCQDYKALLASLESHYPQEPQNPCSAVLTWKSCYSHVFVQVFGLLHGHKSTKIKNN